MRLTERYLHGDPPTPSELDARRARPSASSCRRSRSTRRDRRRRHGRPARASLAGDRRRCTARRRSSAQLERLASLPLAERRELPGARPGAGAGDRRRRARSCARCSRRYGLDELEFSVRDLLDGAALAAADAAGARRGRRAARRLHVLLRSAAAAAVARARRLRRLVGRRRPRRRRLDACRPAARSRRSTRSSRRSWPGPTSLRRRSSRSTPPTESDGRTFVTPEPRQGARAPARPHRRSASADRLLSLRVSQAGHQPRPDHLPPDPVRPGLPGPRHPRAARAGRRHDRLRPRPDRGLGAERALTGQSDTCARKVSCYDPCVIKYLSRKERHEHDRADTGRAFPTGTWKADTVHSRVAFEVPYAVATFTGEVPTFEATLEDGTLTGVAQIASLKVKEENLEAHLLSPEFFDAERHPEVTFVSQAITPRRRRRRDRRRDHDQGHHEARDADRHRDRPRRRPLRRERASGLKLETTVDRTEFDINWNMPLPNGEPALANDVTLKADLTLVAAGPRRNSARPRDQRLAPRATRTTRPSSAPCARRRRTASRSSSGTGSRRSRRTTRTTTSCPGPETVEALPRAGARGRRRLLRDARVQLVRPGRAQERARLGLAPARDERRSATSPSP